MLGKILWARSAEKGVCPFADQLRILPRELLCIGVAPDAGKIADIHPDVSMEDPSAGVCSPLRFAHVMRLFWVDARRTLGVVRD
jgi:hypothetical protein